MKHYPILVAGKKAAACVETGWEWAVVSLKFSHRKGQTANFAYEPAPLIRSIWVDKYPTYTALRFQTRQEYFNSPQDAIRYCANFVCTIDKCVNFEADEALVTKELLTALG